MCLYKMRGGLRHTALLPIVNWSSLIYSLRLREMTIHRASAFIITNLQITSKVHIFYLSIKSVSDRSTQIRRLLNINYLKFYDRISWGQELFLF